MKNMRPCLLRWWRAGWTATVALVALLAAGLPAVAAAQQGPGGMTPMGPGGGCQGAYWVQFGDTLASIAQRNGVTIGDLMQVNDVHNPNLIYAGQMLAIPCGGMSMGGPVDYSGMGGAEWSTPGYPMGGPMEPMPMGPGDGGNMGMGQPMDRGGMGGPMEPIPAGHGDGGNMGQPMNQGGMGGPMEPMPMGPGDGGNMGMGQPMDQGGMGGRMEPTGPGDGGNMGQPMNQGGMGGPMEPTPMGPGDGGNMGIGQPMDQGGMGGRMEPMGPGDGGNTWMGQPMDRGGMGGPMEPMPMDPGDGGMGMDGHGWMGPIPGNDWDTHPDMDFWKGSYFKDKYFSEFVEERQDVEVRFNWYTDSPGPNIPNDRFSARWERVLTLAGGHYVFFATADDGVRVIVDDSTIIDAWKIQPATDYEADVFLHPGKHRIVVEYYEEAEDALVSVHWKQLGR